MHVFLNEVSTGESEARARSTSFSFRGDFGLTEPLLAVRTSL